MQTRDNNPGTATISSAPPVAEHDGPVTDDRPVPGLVADAVDEVLAAAETWRSWDGKPVRHGAEVGDEWTPQKVLRRVADHLVDHLAEMEARRAGQSPRLDGWAGRTVTLPADMATFTERDLGEVRERLVRLSDIWRWRLADLSDAAADARPDATVWTLREIVHHLADATRFYARQMTLTG